MLKGQCQRISDDLQAGANLTVFKVYHGPAPLNIPPPTAPTAEHIEIAWQGNTEKTQLD